ncbi:MAG: sulfatase, partial [Spirochaetaceae bacterium]
AVVSLMNPHNICEWARGAFLPDATLPPPPIDLPPLPANFGIAEPEPGWIREFLRRRSAHYIAPGYDETQWRQYRWAYWRLCEEADRQVGNVMSALRVHGFDKSTVVVFASDHGDGVAAHHVCQKQVFYEESARVPLIVRPPHCTAGTNARLTNAGMDILPTLLDYADIAVPRELHGTTLRSAVEGCEATQPQYVVCETDFCPGPERWGASGRMVRTKRYKYTVHDALDKNDITEQFFDIEMDPGEMQNLIGTAAARHQVEHHRSLLAKWQKDTEDHWRPQAP